MLKRVLFILVVFIVVSCSKEDLPVLPVQDLEEKNVQFHLFTAEDFSEKRFNDAFVKVELVVILKDAEGNFTPLFEKTYDWVHFREFPKNPEKIVEQFEVRYDRNSEKVYASYGLYTRIDGHLSAEGLSFSLPSGESQHQIVVEL